MRDAYAVPAELAAIRDEFQAVSASDRLQLLLEYADDLPELPARYRDVPLERVAECQSPVYIMVEILDGRVNLFATAPRESPTTRGFAAILVRGITGLTAAEVRAIPGDYPQTLGLTEAVSPLRMRGMTAMLAQIRRRVTALTDASAPEATA